MKTIKKNKREEIRNMINSCSKKFNSYRNAFKKHDYVLTDLRSFFKKLQEIFDSIPDLIFRYEINNKENLDINFYAEIFTILGFIEAIKNIYRTTSLDKSDENQSGPVALDAISMFSLISELKLRVEELQKFFSNKSQ